MKFVKKSRVLALVSTALCLAACMDIRAVDRKNRDEKDRIVRPLAVSAPWEIQRTGEFNEYRVVFKNLEAGLLSVEREWVIEGKDGASTKVLPLRLGVAKGRAMDSQVEGGKTYRYHWIDAETGERIPGKFVTVKVPLDLRIDREITPETELGKVIFGPEKTRPVYGKIVFLEKGALTTNGHDLRIEADLIEGENVTIRTFSSGNEAKKKEDLVDGGEIFFTVRKMTGRFHFDLSGRQGHQGEPGKKPGPELNGKDGPPGKPGSSGHQQIVCSPTPVPGGPGQRGHTGYPGGSGGKGGDTAKLTLKIEDGSEFRRTFAGRPGRGGEGGIGGEGGAGGRGGWSGKPAFPCRAVYGPNGEQGDRGRHGDWGQPGKESPIFEWRDGKMEEIKRGDEP